MLQQVIVKTSDDLLNALAIVVEGQQDQTARHCDQLPILVLSELCKDFGINFVALCVISEQAMTRCVEQVKLLLSV